MRNVDDQIRITNESICKAIDTITTDERGFLSQNILGKLRTFVEAVSVKASGRTEYSYDIFQNEAKLFVSSRSNLKFLTQFHKLLQKTVSHYLPDEENSERLMLKYYEYLLKIKSFLESRYEFVALENIGNFPISTDPALKEYYGKIVEKIYKPLTSRKNIEYRHRYYIKKQKPFFINNEVFYEVTFTTAIDNVSKFDRVIAFTQHVILDNYAVRLSVSGDKIEVFGKNMPIQIIDDWEVAIRPCEINNYAKILGDYSQISTVSSEYRNLMSLLKRTGFNLVDVMGFSDDYYQRFKTAVLKNAKTTHLTDVLTECRRIIKDDLGGSNVIRYLLYRLTNKNIKLQLSTEPCSYLSNLNLHWGCIPFDQMPFVTSLIGHNPKVHDLFNCIDAETREHELFARRIKSNTENKGCLYTSIEDLPDSIDIDQLIKSYNNKLYYRHRPQRDLETYKKHVYINNYEKNTHQIAIKLQGLSISGVRNYSNSVNAWLGETNEVDCDNKKEILTNMFEHSHASLIYGAAGTGKTKLIEHISNFFHTHNKLYLANTNPAINNLKSRVGSANSTFKTISSYIHSQTQETDFDLLIIDECSTVSNSDMIQILEKGTYRLLIFVGDVFQIESISFGNWFNTATSLMPETSIFELTKPYRTTNTGLLDLWDKVRNIENDILENITNNNYSSNLDDSIFDYSEDDEIILCLNYDGLYGINNINKFLQGNNENKSVQWGVHNYKIGDPILFNESMRFKPLIHNNLKGKIVDIEEFEDQIKFDVEIYKSINELDTYGYELELLDESSEGRSIIRFSVNRLESTDEDSESSSAFVPFQVSYAVSIHKAQGLEYKSVKVIITNEIEELVTHNIFYTAITRAKERLKIYWTPETEKKVLESLKTAFNNKDNSLLKSKFNL